MAAEAGRDDLYDILLTELAKDVPPDNLIPAAQTASEVAAVARLLHMIRHAEKYAAELKVWKKISRRADTELLSSDPLIYLTPIAMKYLKLEEK